MTNFVNATYYPEERIAEYVTAEGKRLLRRGGSLCWLLNNCGNLVSPLKEGKPAPKKTKNYIGFAKAGSQGHHFFIFKSYEAGREEVKAWLARRSTLTLAACIEAYAPSHENDTKKYVSDLEKISGVESDRLVSSLTDAELTQVVDALERKEGYHRDADTRQEKWIESTSITATNGSAPIPGMELQMQRGTEIQTLKANQFGQFPPVPHLRGAPVVIKAPKEDGTWETILELTERTASKAYSLLVDLYTFSATMMSDKAPAGTKTKRDPIQYRVQPGDNLSKIAKKFHTSVDDLKMHNRIQGDAIFAEQVLWIYAVGVDVGPKVPKPAIPPKAPAPAKAPTATTKAQTPAPALTKAATPAPAKPKKPAADTAPLVRGQDGGGKPLALITPELGRAPWMAIAIAEAKKQAGRTEDGLIKKIVRDPKSNIKKKITANAPSGTIDTNYHLEINTGFKSLAGSSNAWCAAFVNWVLKKSGYPTDGGTWSARARGFLSKGGKGEVGSHPLFGLIDKPVYGAIAVVGKKNRHGTHVGFFYGKQGENGVILGGNQSQQIRFSPFKLTDLWFLVPSSYTNFLDEEVDDVNFNDLNNAFGMPNSSGDVETR